MKLICQLARNQSSLFNKNRQKSCKRNPQLQEKDVGRRIQARLQLQY